MRLAEATGFFWWPLTLLQRDGACPGCTCTCIQVCQSSPQILTFEQGAGCAEWHKHCPKHTCVGALYLSTAAFPLSPRSSRVLHVMFGGTAARTHTKHLLKCPDTTFLKTTLAEFRRRRPLRCSARSWTRCRVCCASADTPDAPSTSTSPAQSSQRYAPALLRPYALYTFHKTCNGACRAAILSLDAGSGESAVGQPSLRCEQQTWDPLAADCEAASLSACIMLGAGCCAGAGCDGQIHAMGCGARRCWHGAGRYRQLAAAAAQAAAAWRPPQRWRRQLRHETRSRKGYRRRPGWRRPGRQLLC